ncbi:hypothetical protein CLOP_g450 [Closterium sp. NIES-67]|nr:hypothetical protein CLOP_g450 [Closterium sp. NIES-67]
MLVDDYMCYTMVFPLERKADVPDVLIPWVVAARLHCGLPVLYLSDWHFYHPPSHRFFHPRDAIFDEFVAFYHRFPH